MALLCYLRSISGLPNPRGPLSLYIPLSLIAEANREVREASSKEKKHGAYSTYTPATLLEIAKYTCQHGVASAAPVFSHRLDRKVSESTVTSIRDACKRELRRKRADEDEEMSVLQPRKRGKECYLDKTWTRRGAVVYKEN